jgi:sugar phosphate isomerase/epimerase
MEISICSYSFHRALRDGKHDMFQYITDCKELGATQLEPWNGHFKVSDETAGQPPLLDTVDGAAYVQKMKAAAAEVGLPFGCVAVDGAHIYEEDAAARQANARRADQWLAVVAELGGRQMRVDSGYRADEWPDDVFDIIVAGYNELIAKAQAKGVEIVIENHWGPSKHPENVVKLMDAVDGLGLLFDTNNWVPEKQELAWEMCAKYATATHVKTFEFDAAGNDPTTNLTKAINLLRQAGYDGCWGIESVPKNGNEYEGARKTVELIRRVLSQ